MPSSESAILPRLRGLKFDRLFAEARNRASAPMPADWKPPEPGELTAWFPGFQIIRLIGRGGMGAVYEARQLALDRRVAIKLLPSETGDDATFAERFRHEARTLAKLQHANIVAVFESGATSAGHLFFVMEYVEGGDLAERTRRRRFEPGEALRIVDEISSALACAHAQGVVHRDIKPSNILLTADHHVKVADFGLAVLEDRDPDSKLTLTGIALGTFDYAAPEQLSGRGGEDARSDLFSLGVLAYELLAGKPPRGVFDPPSLANPAVDPAVDAVVLTAMQSEPERRFQTAEDFAVALNRARDFRANQMARERELRRKARRRARLAFGAFLAAAAASAMAVYAFVQRQHARENEADARHQRIIAQAARAEAEGLVDFMLTDLRKKLQASNDLTYLTDILARVEKYYGAHANRSNDPAFLRSKADFYRVDSNVREALGDYRRAETSASREIAIREALAESREERDLRELTRARYQLQAVYQTERDYDHSLAAVRDGIRAAEGWVAAIPKSIDARAWLARFHHVFGDLHAWHGDLAEAEKEFLIAQRMFEEQVAVQPEKVMLNTGLAVVHASLGSLREAQNDLASALAHFQRMKEINDRVNGKEDHASVTSSSFRVGVALRKLGRFKEALPVLEEAVEAGAKHLAQMPNDQWRMRTQVWNYKELAVVQEALGLSRDATASQEAKAALEKRGEAVALAAMQTGTAGSRRQSLDEGFEKLRAAPEGNDVQYYWAMASEAEGSRIEAISGAAAAIEHFRTQIARIEAEMRNAPSTTWWRLGRSFAWNRIGFYETSIGDREAAAVAYRNSLADRVAMLAAHPEVDRLSRDVSSSASHLALTLLELNRAADADEVCRSTMVLLRGRDRGRLVWRDILPRNALTIAAKLDAPAAAVLLDDAAAFLAGLGEPSLPDEERALLEKIRSAKK